MLTKEDVVQKFKEGVDCSMVVLAAVADDIGITKDMAYRIASCFGAGMSVGGVCGAVTGGLMAIGIKHGNSKENDLAQKEILISKRNEFLERFKKAHESVNCPVLLGANLRDAEQRFYAHRNGTIDNECPRFCITAVQLLKEIL
jgi:C_GCAxxG_C_C family probable redox protein